MDIYRRRRGAAIVDTNGGIIVVSRGGEWFTLPGGKAKNRESRSQAAMRELKEETDLNAHDAKFLFKHLGGVHKSGKGYYFQNHNKVFLVEAKGKPRPKNEINYVDYYTPDSDVQISSTTQGMLKKYYEFKRSKWDTH
ncbi:NUDIX domain-containing protein [Methanohalophilus halophilus]|uniref:ADP-ribose pyrophosphatase YjhB, NUDIX family n=1 Tax=Methanohalophilus halophilus TaxID=2177 RepID=A0A1L3Q4B7_9EURY|nr:NUDIX domain-containing protein [Methanohalophilus halophilus]APH39724.1 hypothetical protein BHR79_09690 [Methanohalophilus halophilus]RNI08938.1 NUDIX domain-containing protein [Methanohalophilus halophilus]SDW37513.1 ADP-ribose pyrophosphatase YjhB, NUDIX family [Methanohalophilus halophilus]